MNASWNHVFAPFPSLRDYSPCGLSNLSDWSVCSGIWFSTFLIREEKNCLVILLSIKIFQRSLCFFFYFQFFADKMNQHFKSSDSEPTNRSIIQKFICNKFSVAKPTIKYSFLLIKNEPLLFILLYTTWSKHTLSLALLSCIELALLCQL